MAQPSVGCYKPKKKDIKKKLVSAKEARDMIEDLYDNDYLPYEVAQQVRGSILLHIYSLEKELEDVS